MQDDSLRAVLDSVFSAPAYRWAPEPGAAAWLERWWAALLGWLEHLRLEDPLLFRLLLAGLILILLAVIAHAVSVLYRVVRGAAAPVSPGRSTSRPPPRDAAWHRADAGRLAAEGRYGDAMRAGFLALVLELDGRGALRFHLSKTPHEYAREARLGEAGRSRLVQLVATLYRHSFGGIPCGPDDYERWQRAAREAWDAAAA
jgi:hypothetical protein